jgi:hypothetical protein
VDKSVQLVRITGGNVAKLKHKTWQSLSYILPLVTILKQQITCQLRADRFVHPLNNINGLATKKRDKASSMVKVNELIAGISRGPSGLWADARSVQHRTSHPVIVCVIGENPLTRTT